MDAVMTTRKCVLQTWLLVCAAANLHIPGRNVIVNVNVSLNAVLLHTVNYIGSIPVGGSESIDQSMSLAILMICRCVNYSLLELQLLYWSA